MFFSPPFPYFPSTMMMPRACGTSSTAIAISYAGPLLPSHLQNPWLCIIYKGMILFFFFGPSCRTIAPKRVVITCKQKHHRAGNDGESPSPSRDPALKVKIAEPETSGNLLAALRRGQLFWESPFRSRPLLRWILTYSPVPVACRRTSSHQE